MKKESVAAYGLMEPKFVWTPFQASGGKKEKAYKFNDKQKKALNNLSEVLDELEDGKDNWDSAVNACYKVFDEVYFPEKYETRTDFDMPPGAFLAIQCVAEYGSYSNIYSSHLLCHIQFLREQYL